MVDLRNTDIITARVIEELMEIPYVNVAVFESYIDTDTKKRIYKLSLEYNRHDIHIQIDIKDKDIGIYAKAILEALNNLNELYTYLPVRIVKRHTWNVFDLMVHNDIDDFTYRSTVVLKGLSKHLNKLDLNYYYQLAYMNDIIERNIFAPVITLENVHTYNTPRYRYKYAYDNFCNSILIGQFTYNVYDKPVLMQIQLTSDKYTKEDVHKKVITFIDYIEDEQLDKYRGKLIYLDNEEYIECIPLAIIEQRV